MTSEILTTGVELERNQLPVIVRHLQPADLLSVARIHSESFADSLLTRLGTEVVRRYYQWQIESPDEVIARGAFCGNHLVGFCFSGIFREAMTGFLRRQRLFLVWRVLTHPRLVLDPTLFAKLAKGVQILGVNLLGPLIKRETAKKTVPQGLSTPRFRVLSLAVAPKARQRGIGRILMAEAEQAAARFSYPDLGLSVDTTNVQAIVFYEKLGWERMILSDGSWTGQMKKVLRQESIG